MRSESKIVIEMLYLTGNVKRIEDANTNRTFVRDENGEYYEEIDSPLGRKYFRKLDIPPIVRRDIMEGVKGELLI